MKRIACLLLCLPLLLCGCMLEPNVESLMSPPKLSKEQTQVYDALTEVVGNNVKLHYPSQGEHRAPFVFCDLDGDDVEEALVLYYPDASGSNVRINVLEQEQGNWRSVYDISGYSGQVDSVYFLSLPGAAGMDFVVGWQMYSLDENVFTLYEYEKGKISDLYSDSFAKLQVIGDGKEQQLAVLQRNQAARTAGLKLIGRKRDEVATIAEAVLSPDTESFEQMICGKTPEGEAAFFIDGMRSDGMLTTQVVAYEDEDLVNLSYDPGQSLDLMVAAARADHIVCRDIDGDGVTEIPVPMLIPGYEDYPEEEQRFLTSWSVIEGSRYREKLRSFMNTQDGYYFKIPEEWENRYTVYYDEELDEYLFVQHLVGGLSKTRVFMKLRTCRQGDDWNRSGLESYFLAGNRGMREYYAYLAGWESQSEIYVSKSLFSANFTLLPQ